MELLKSDGHRDIGFRGRQSHLPHAQPCPNTKHTRIVLVPLFMRVEERDAMCYFIYQIENCNKEEQVQSQASTTHPMRNNCLSANLNTHRPAPP